MSRQMNMYKTALLLALVLEVFVGLLILGWARSEYLKYWQNYEPEAEVWEVNSA